MIAQFCSALLSRGVRRICASQSRLPPFPNSSRSASFVLSVARNAVLAPIMAASRNASSSPSTAAARLWACEEIEIPVPHGVIAAKRWGPADGHPVMCLHGWQENAAAFDRLVPLLSPDLGLSLVCLDWAGCGHSSHYPPGFPYYELDALLLLNRVRHFLGWDRFSLVGHSLGGGLSQLFAGTFPELVVSVAVIDIMRPVFRAVETYPQRLRKSVESYLDWEYLLNDKEVITPVYTWQEARDRLVKAAPSLTPESADVLLSRGLRPAVTPDGREGYVYRRDPRHKISSFTNLTPGQLEAFLSGIRCPMLVVKGARGPKYEGPQVHEEVKRFFAEKLDDFRYVEVDGNHHVHLNNPDLVAAPLNEFFNDVYAEKDSVGKSKL